MGRYRAALAQAQGTGSPPDITAVRRSGAVKYGFGLNFEQPLADGGATGLFGRWGWNDGATESFVSSEVYYAYQLSKLLALTLDYQAIQNPGFNRDRGPVSVLSVRLHAQF